VRQVDQETGEARTIVRNDDGSLRTFGWEEVRTLAEQCRKKAKEGLQDFSSHQLRGLVHEVGQRLITNSHLYHRRLAELKSLGKRLNYRYFGLDEDASDKDLDNAYRRMAKQLHPDKNGGTESAKMRFQHMKERYEALKKHREADKDCANSADPSGDDGGDVKSENGDEDSATREADGEEESLGGHEKNEDGELEEESKKRDKGAKQKSVSVTYDPNDRGSMERTALQMLEQVHSIEVQTGALLKELQRARAQLPT